MVPPPGPVLEQRRPQQPDARAPGQPRRVSVIDSITRERDRLDRIFAEKDADVADSRSAPWVLRRLSCEERLACDGLTAVDPRVALADLG